MANEMDAVKRIVEAFERSDWQEIDVRWGDLRVHLSTDRNVGQVASKVSPRSPDRAMLEADVGDQPRSVEQTAGPVAARRGQPVEVEDGVGLHHVVTPSPGIFWRAPEPGAPPFVEVGTVVEPADTLCIVEIMKLMNHVKAGVSGRIVEVMVADGTEVAMGDPLFAIVPDTPGSGP